MGHLFIVTHTDLDGAGSAAAALIAYGRGIDESTILFAEPYNLDEVLSSLSGNLDSGDRIVVSDLGPNRDSIDNVLRLVGEFTGQGVAVDWYDHHIWPDEWREAMRRAGVRLTIDTSTCATGVVARYATKYNETEYTEYLKELESTVCAADLWRWDHPLAPKLFRVADTRYNEGSNEWRRKLIAKFSQGVLWDEELDEKLQEYLNRELENFNKIISTTVVAEGECRVAAAFKERGPPANSFIGASLLSRYNADIAVIIRGNGGLSLRSRGVNVQIVALSLGGGGHPRAAGARLDIPLLVRLFGRLWRKAVPRYAARLVLKTAEETGVCRGIGSEVESARMM
ncbi:MAG: DHHA1 domain-containing protein [Desulfurococcales archaeon]|nr:DHHA1 domain-containing protein [Desulfurococcales archaeon]